MPTKMTPEVITAAIQGFESQKSQINAQIAELRAMLHGRTMAVSSETETATPRKRRRMSAAARKRIAAAQKKRWAEARKESAPKAAAPKRKRRLSAAGRRRIIEATKKRWALVRAGKSGAGKKKAAAKQATPAAS